ncbi:MAG: hypothetical protein CME86_27740 [Herbaspirillum sp.]|nr:hypothetical protein [Herbaspirillum sp.]|tara:strand:+ start:16525 stop:16794 length:270 start_codon:yes stop_codon:yes gene_type:complete
MEHFLMKTIQITRPGVFRNGKDMVAVGTQLQVPNDFNGWPGKWIEVSSDEGKTLEVATPKRPRKKRHPRQEQEPEQPSLDTEAEPDDND